MEEVSQQDDAEETNYSSMSLPQPPNTSGKSISSASATNQINPPAAIPRKPSSNEIPELTTLSIDSKPSQYLMADGAGLQQQPPQNAVNPPPFPSSSSSKAFSGLSPDLIEQLFASADKTIAESILQDIVQPDLNIQFDDIASLNDAKRILYEAIILPSMMPEFFTGIREPWKVNPSSFYLFLD
jgi:SpoVK/Ycf46/Vps4 family AAA+-type ATPase